MDRSPEAYHSTSGFEHAAFYSEDVFAVVGNRSTVLWIFRDADGLQQASFKSVSDANYRLTGVHMVSETEALIVSDEGVLFHTENRGASWKDFQLSESALRGILFFDDQNGFIYGDDGLLLQTNNGGDDWNEIQSDTGNDWNSALLVNENFAILAGDAGTIARTDNAGADWQFDVVNSDYNLLDLAIFDDTIYTLERSFYNSDTFETTYTMYSAGIGLDSNFEPAYSHTGQTAWSRIVAVTDTHFVIEDYNLISLCSGIQQLAIAEIQEGSQELLIGELIELDAYVGSYIPVPSDEHSFLVVGSWGYLGMYDTAAHSAKALVVRDYTDLYEEIICSFLIWSLRNRTGY